MSSFFEYLYTVFTRIWDYLSSTFDYINDSIDFIYTGATWLGSLILNLPVAIQGTFMLFLVLAIICLFLNR